MASKRAVRDPKILASCMCNESWPGSLLLFFCWSSYFVEFCSDFERQLFHSITGEGKLRFLPSAVRQRRDNGMFCRYRDVILARKANCCPIPVCQKPLMLHGHERSITQIKYNQEGDLLFSVAKDNTPTVWYSVNGERLGTYDGHNGAVWCVDVSCILQLCTVSVSLWSFSRKVRRSAPSSVFCFIVAASMYKLEKLFRAFSFQIIEINANLAKSCTCREREGVCLLTVCRNKKDEHTSICGVRLRKTESSSGCVFGHWRVVLFVLDKLTSDDSRHVLTGSADNTARLWDCETGVQLAELKSSTSVRTCGFSYSGKQVMISTDKQMGKPCEIQLYDISDARQMGKTVRDRAACLSTRAGISFPSLSVWVRFVTLKVVEQWRTDFHCRHTGGELRSFGSCAY